jgi:predicted signal transduction protein with EAL and GGDEF domain
LIGEPYEIEGERVLVGASVGIAVEPECGASAELLLKYADMALYEAKANGRATWCFYEARMDLLVQTRRALSADLRDAIRLGQLEVHYQPLINLGAERIAGFEALLRWRHPERGLVSPGQFIPIAEETGLISVIGDWVLRQACQEAVRWPEPVSVSVNLSPRQFRNNNVARAVKAALDQTGLAPGRLELEITESLLLQDGEDVLTALGDLRALGVGVALDDFGTGYASLSYLRKFPFSKLKIDQSFVRGMEQREDCIIIIQAVAALAKRLGMTVTAEGVETEEQLAIVREAGCTHGQGYLFGRPAPPAEATRLLARDLSHGRAHEVAI